MSLQTLEHFFFKLKSDGEVRNRFLEDPAGFAGKLDLTEVERRALVERDLVALYRMGTHPLLLFPFARAIGLSVPEYRKIMAPLAGERLFRS